MLKYRYAVVVCVCGKIAHVPRLGQKFICSCGAELWTKREENGLEIPIATVPDNYVTDNIPAIVGWTSR